MEILRIAASANNIYSHSAIKVLGGFLVAGSDAASALIYDALTAAGTDKFSIKAVATDMNEIIFPQPFILSTGLSVTLTGTGAVLYLFIE